MFKYALALKDVAVAGGIDSLDEQRKEIFKGLLTFMSTVIKNSNEVDDVEVTDDFTLIVTASKDIEATLNKLGGNAIITRL